MVKKKTTKKNKSQRIQSPISQLKSTPNKRLGLGIGVLVLNLLIPGLGTLLAGHINTGIWQLLLLIIGSILSPVLIGIPLVIIAWVWALISSIGILKEMS